MPDPQDQPDEREDRESATPYERFEALTKRLLHVSKDDVHEEADRERDRQARETA